MTFSTTFPTITKATHAPNNHQPACRFLRFSNITAIGRQNITAAPAIKIPHVKAINRSSGSLMRCVANVRYGSIADDQADRAPNVC